MASVKTEQTPDWSPFWVDATAWVAPRALRASDFSGVGDRLRAAAFAELQAERAFVWAARQFGPQAPAGLAQAWVALAAEEAKHRHWLLGRLQELKLSIAERPVNDVLWRSLTACGSAREFALYMAGAEERGRRAGERFCESLKAFDPVSARIFGEIAREERAHIELAHRFFPEAG